VEQAPPPDSAAIPPAPFRAGKAFLTLALFFAAQFFGSLVVVTAVVAQERPGKSVQIQPYYPHLMLAAGVASALATVWMTWGWASAEARDKSSTGLGLIPPPGNSLLTWAAAGAALSGTYVAFALLSKAGVTNSRLGPLAQMSHQGGFARLAWAIIALGTAPPSEELLFRGLMLRGFTASWGRRTAGVLTTLLFVAIHLTETWYYWPATIWVAAMAVTALVARRKTGSLWCSIAAHVSYNFVIVVTMMMLN